jgi:hypothetical protein
MAGAKVRIGPVQSDLEAWPPPAMVAGSARHGWSSLKGAKPLAPPFHRRRFDSIRQLQAEADSWLVTYNHRRRNHGDYMRRRTPHEVLDNHKRYKAA